VTRRSAALKGSGSEATRFCGASAESVAAGFFPPNGSQVPRAGARGHHDDWPPEHHPPVTDRAPSRQGAGLRLSAGVCAATLVCLGAGPQVTGFSVDFWSADWTGGAGRRCYGRSTPGASRLRQGTPSRWGALDPPLYGVSGGAEGGRLVGAGHVAGRDQALGPPGVARLIPWPRMGSGPWDAPSNACASGPAAGGPRATLVSRPPVQRCGG
jgi:hypothetical protein